MRKLFSLLALVCILAVPAIAIVGCGGAPSSEPTGVSGSGEVELTEDEIADEEASLNESPE